MKKSLSLLAFGLLGCTLAATSAHAAPATGDITRNYMTMDAYGYITITVIFSAQNNTPTQGTLEVGDSCYAIDGRGPGSNYYLVTPNPPYTVPIASSQAFGGADKGPWTMKKIVGASRSYAYNNDVVLTAALGSPVYRVQLATNNIGPKRF